MVLSIQYHLTLPAKCSFQVMSSSTSRKLKFSLLTTKTYVSLKLRNSGEDGHFLTDESIYLGQELKQVELLKSGKVIKC